MPILVVGAVLFSALLHAAWNAVLRQTPNRDCTVAWIGVSSALFALPFALYLGPPTHAWGFVLASAALHLGYLYLLAQAYRLSELSFAYPIARGSSPALVALGGCLFASERLGTFQWIGILAIALGILALGLDRNSWDAKGLALAVFIGIVISLYTVIDAFGARACLNSARYNAWDFTIYGGAIGLGNLVFNRGQKLAGDAGSIRFGVLGGVASVAAYSIVVWGMVRYAMGPISALRETSSLFAMIIGVVFLKESFTRNRLLGSTLIVLGAALVALLKS